MLMVIYRIISYLPKSKKLIKFGGSNLGILVKMVVMFGFVSFGWLFFRANSVEHAFQLISNVSVKYSSQSIQYVNDLIFFGLPILLVQIWQAVKSDLLVVAKLRFPLQLIVNTIILVCIIVFGPREVSEFIYTQF
jgi:D-alanyl-lipoteichoic acid acyltransferase DltB (MBOAT superfamily)